MILVSDARDVGLRLKSAQRKELFAGVRKQLREEKKRATLYRALRLGCHGQQDKEDNGEIKGKGNRGSPDAEGNKLEKVKSGKSMKEKIPQKKNGHTTR